MCFKKTFSLNTSLYPNFKNMKLLKLKKHCILPLSISDALSLLEEYEDLDDYSPDINFSSDDAIESEMGDVYQVIAPQEPSEDDILALALDHEKQNEPIYLWL